MSLVHLTDRAGIAGAVLLVVLGAGLLIRVTNRTAVPPKNPDRVPAEIRTGQTATVIETMDLRNGNVHVEIPIRVARQKTAVPSFGH
jgi:membrane protein implicated in regulation of membrane protease activity